MQNKQPRLQIFPPPPPQQKKQEYQNTKHKFNPKTEKKQAFVVRSQ